MPRKKIIKETMTEVEKMPDFDESKPEFDTSELENLKLPAYPMPLREWRADESRYVGSDENYRKRIIHKLYSVWILWGHMRVSEKLMGFFKTQTEDESSPEYELKCILLDIMDNLGKTLGDTNILEEIAWLAQPDEEVFFKELKASKERADAQKQSDTWPSPTSPQGIPKTPTV
jgi:hypothetical protein